MSPNKSTLLAPLAALAGVLVFLLVLADQPGSALADHGHHGHHGHHSAGGTADRISKRLREVDTGRIKTGFSNALHAQW